MFIKCTDELYINEAVSLTFMLRDEIFYLSIYLHKVIVFRLGLNVVKYCNPGLTEK